MTDVGHIAVWKKVFLIVAAIPFLVMALLGLWSVIALLLSREDEENY